MKIVNLYAVIWVLFFQPNGILILFLEYFTYSFSVTQCKMGIRAGKVTEFLKSQGYSNVSVYPGSLIDWISSGGKIINGEMDKARFVDFDEMKEILSQQNILVIDVRNPKERKNPGYIPGTKNVPRKYLVLFSKKL